LCFNSDGASCEILKNLILAGTGYVSIVDDQIINSSDLSENFFLNSKDVGKNRAEVCLQNLLELNPDVKGNYFKCTVNYFIENHILEFQTYDVIILTNQHNVNIFN
jgi:molybdopterin/thiamine biosynthesis adenylyltransferase